MTFNPSETFTTLYLFSSEKLWLGLTDLDVRTVWRLDDNGYIATWTYWDESSQPDMNERCVTLYPDLWHNVGCESSFKYCCERGN